MLSMIVKKKQGRVPGSNEFGKLIRDKRRSERLSIRDAAERIDIGHGGLSELERGLRTPDFETIAKFNSNLGIPLDELARAAARDLGFQPATTEEAFQALAASLTARAQMYPDLRKILDHLATADPDRYQAFLVMFETFQRLDQDGSQGNGHRS